MVGKGGLSRGEAGVRLGGGWVEGKGGTGADGSSGSGLFWADFLKADTQNTEKCSCVLGFASF